MNLANKVEVIGVVIGEISDDQNFFDLSIKYRTWQKYPNGWVRGTRTIFIGAGINRAIIRTSPTTRLKVIGELLSDGTIYAESVQLAPYSIPAKAPYFTCPICGTNYPGFVTAAYCCQPDLPEVIFKSWDPDKDLQGEREPYGD